MSDYLSALTSSTQSTTGTSLYDTEDGSVMGKEDFMMLLVAQLSNQDPLNPDDPTEFTAQLAQFSSLEQLYNINDGLESLVASNETSDKISTLETIGKDVAYYGSELDYSGSAVEFGYQLGSTASQVTISLKQNGATLATLNGTEMGAGNHFITWDGLTSDGDAAPIGDYDVVISATDSTGAAVSVAPLIRAEVTGVDLGGTNGGTLITTAGEISFNAIIGVFEPGTSSNSSSSSTDDEEDTDEEESTVDTIEDGVDSVEETIDSIETITDALT